MQSLRILIVLLLVSGLVVSASRLDAFKRGHRKAKRNQSPCNAIAYDDPDACFKVPEGCQYCIPSILPKTTRCLGKGDKPFGDAKDLNEHFKKVVDAGQTVVCASNMDELKKIIRRVERFYSRVGTKPAFKAKPNRTSRILAGRFVVVVGKYAFEMSSGTSNGKDTRGIFFPVNGFSGIQEALNDPKLCLFDKMAGGGFYGDFFFNFDKPLDKQKQAHTPEMAKLVEKIPITQTQGVTDQLQFIIARFNTVEQLRISIALNDHCEELLGNISLPKPKRGEAWLPKLKENCIAAQTFWRVPSMVQHRNKIIKEINDDKNKAPNQNPIDLKLTNDEQTALEAACKGLFRLARNAAQLNGVLKENLPQGQVDSDKHEELMNKLKECPAFSSTLKLAKPEVASPQDNPNGPNGGGQQEEEDEEEPTDDPNGGPVSKPPPVSPTPPTKTDVQKST